MILTSEQRGAVAQVVYELRVVYNLLREAKLRLDWAHKIAGSIPRNFGVDSQALVDRWCTVSTQADKVKVLRELYVAGLDLPTDDIPFYD